MAVERVRRVERLFVLNFGIMRIGPDLEENLREGDRANERARVAYIATDEPSEKKEDAENLQLINDERCPRSMLNTGNQPMHKRLFGRMMFCHVYEEEKDDRHRTVDDLPNGDESFQRTIVTKEKTNNNSRQRNTGNQ